MKQQPEHGKKAPPAKRPPRLEWISTALRALAVPIGTLTPDPKNVRVHEERNRASIRASLERFGQQVPVVLIRRGRQQIVLKGNGILGAAQELGWSHLAAVESGLAGADATAFAIADNRTSDLSVFDEQLLAAQLQELEEAEYDLAAAGFTDAELQDLVETVEAGAANADPVPVARRRGERTALFLVGHLKFEVPREAFDRWIAAVETRVGNDPDRLVREIKRRLGLK